MAVTVPALRGTLKDVDFSRYLAPEVVAALGDVVARESVALRDFTHPGHDRALQWDLRYADRTIDLLLSHVVDEDRRDLVRTAAAEAWATVSSVAADLPLQTVRLDITDDKVVWRPQRGHLVPDGVIDSGDLTTSWAVSELAITISSVLHHVGAEPASVIPAVRAFSALRPLSDAEWTALWPLVVLRAALLVVSGAHQAGKDVANEYASASPDREWPVFERAVSVPSSVMTRVLRAAVGEPSPPWTLPPHKPLIASLKSARCRVLDLSPESESMDAGAWLDANAADDLAVSMLGRQCDAVVTRFGAARLCASRTLAPTSPATIATGVEVWLAQPARLQSPWAGELRALPPNDASASVEPGGLVLATDDGLDLALAWVDTVECTASGRVEAGETLVSLPVGARFRMTVSRTSGPVVPPLVRPEYATGWLELVTDPSPLLGLETVDAQRDSRLLERLEQVFAKVQEHYYDVPPRIERGWRHHLAAADGRVYLDMMNTVAAVGHGHPRIAAAVSSQWGRLNTNSRFHHASVVEFSERLASLLPDPLDTVFLVNSGSEAVDLALRLAIAATGRRDVVAVREAYHGWTYASEAVSTSVADDAYSIAARPEWVHTVDAPNSYRGRFRGAESSRYAVDAVAAIDDLASSGRAPAAFIAEAFCGNAGGMPLPDGYLATVYDALRRRGGLAIADETQVGYGRLGETFWGFETQSVVPDIVTVARAMGNGHPLGAVITSRDVADRYRADGSFFSSTGGSPTSCVVGMTVLDIIESEDLQKNAVRVGAHLKSRLSALMDRHELIGAVHGSGLCLGVEFVRSRDSLEPAREETDAICNRMLELGVVIQPTGEYRCVLKITPPLCIDVESADYFVDVLDEVLTSGW